MSKWIQRGNVACLRPFSHLNIMLGMDLTHPEPAQGSFYHTYILSFPKGL